MTITIELPDEQAQQWKKEAERLNLTLEQLTAQSVEDRLAGRKRYVTQAIRRIISENTELYRRLA
ncbi:MAG: DNA-binding protein [Armatimonadota bacterium]|nr:DNA-binding protein [Armatimonadota bacterium]